jgi:hypothetical protein
MSYYPDSGGRAARKRPPRGLIFLGLCGVILSLALAGAAPASGQTPEGLYVRNGVLMRHGQPYHGIGANYQALFARLLINKDDTSSLENLAALGKAGIPFVRFRASGFNPKNQKLYLEDRAEFFRRMDRVVQSAEQNHVGLIPSLFWRLRTVAEVVGEQPDQFGNPESKSSAFIRQFTSEMVGRYKNSPAIWGWEFGNEANLATDIPPTQPRRRQPVGRFGGLDTVGPDRPVFTSEALRAVHTLFAKTVREIDSSRMIDTGCGLPRPAAWHNARGQFRQPDNESQFTSVLLAQNPAPVDVISVHIYEKPLQDFHFGSGQVAPFIAGLMQTSAQARKPLFIGEFPTRNRAQTDGFLSAIEENHVPLSAFWVFDYPPQEATMNVDFHNERSFVIDKVAKANAVLRADSH